MHDRLARIDEITETLAGSPLASVARVRQDELAADAALIDILFEQKSALGIRKEACPDKSFESHEYNGLLMAGAEVVAALRDFEEKYGVRLMP
jgi:hypothetical protein